MKNTLILFAALLGCQSCQNNQPEQTNGNPTISTTIDSAYSHFIPVDSANKMISSYLNSINYSVNDTSLHSLVVDAVQLKKYIDEAPDDIVQFKLMLAHRLDYINAGNVNQYAGYNRDALTLVIAGCNADGDYVYLNGGVVLDYSSPCPSYCPPGDASEPLLIH